jgi:hypothetical protein
MKPRRIRLCANCGAEIRIGRYQNPMMVRACSPQCAGQIFQAEEQQRENGIPVPLYWPY